MFALAVRVTPPVAGSATRVFRNTILCEQYTIDRGGFQVDRFGLY